MEVYSRDDDQQAAQFQHGELMRERERYEREKMIFLETCSPSNLGNGSTGERTGQQFAAFIQYNDAEC